MEKWEPKSNEDKLLLKYWTEHKGVVFVEVPVGLSTGQGNWPKGTKVRRIDGVRFNELEEIPDGIYKMSSPSEFTNLLKSVETIDLIEIKTTLNRLVIGQVIAGIDMFKREYGNININPLIICSKSDPGMEWVCENREIEIFKYQS